MGNIGQFLFGMTENTSTTKFYPRLTAMRGIAAVIVAIYHCFLIFNYASHSLDRVIGKLVLFFFHGTTSVVIFFVLSGFVLGISLNKLGSQVIAHYPQFVARRIVRLWPTFVVSTLLALLYIPLFYQLPEFSSVSGWFLNKFQDPITAENIFQNLFFITTDLNPNVWSLKLEVLGSFCLPFLFVYAGKTNRFFDIIFIMVCTGLGYISGYPDLYVLNMFYLGLMVPKWQPIFQYISKFKLPIFMACFLLMNLLMGFGKWTAWQNSLILAVLAFFLVGIVANTKTSEFKWLDHPMANYFGKISYCLYLLQFLTMAMMTHLLDQTLPSAIINQYKLLITLTILVSHLALCTLLAHGLHHWVEVPCIRAAKKLFPKRTTHKI